MNRASAPDTGSVSEQSRNQSQKHQERPPTADLGDSLSGSLRDGFRVWKRVDGWIEVSGEVDVFSSESFRSALSAAIPSSGICCVNLGGLHFIDLSGIQAIVRSAGTATTELRLYSAIPTLRKCWALLECRASAPNVSFCDG